MRQAFAGNAAAAFTALTPLDVMARTPYAHSAVYFAAGAQDGTFSSYMAQVSSAAKHAGIDISTVPVRAWGVPQQALAPALHWFAPPAGSRPLTHGIRFLSPAPGPSQVSLSSGKER
jgi:hypothetical protein